MVFFEPSVSFRQSASGGDVLSNPIKSPTTALTSTSIVLLIHGYNNDQHGASDSYTEWLRLQNAIGAVSANVVAVYWPGDNWESGAYYMQALPKAKSVAALLANELLSAAATLGSPVRVSIVAHSMGARLAYELVSRLQGSAIVFERLAVMAAAVTTRSIKSGAVLRAPLDASRALHKSLFSGSDRVLSTAFPIGESLAGEGFFPTALGHQLWSGSGAMQAAQMQQQEISGAGHGDYWEATGKASGVPQALRSFLPLGLMVPRLTAVPRETPARTTGARPRAPSRARPSSVPGVSPARRPPP